VELLPAWWDVDRPADLVALIGRLAEGSARRAPATARALTEMGRLAAVIPR
jgi:hypothetical protein